MPHPATTIPRSIPPSGKSTVGRRLESIDLPLPAGLKGQFCKRFRKIVQAASVSEVATKLDVSPDFVRKLVSGKNMPDLNDLPTYAKKLGLASWFEFFDRQKSS